MNIKNNYLLPMLRVLNCKVLKPDLLKLYESEEDKLITVDSTTKYTKRRNRYTNIRIS